MMRDRSRLPSCVAFANRFAFASATLMKCRKSKRFCATAVGRAEKNAEAIAAVFRKQRQILAPLQGQERTTWLQVLQIGDITLAGVPGEFFTKLGLDIKRRSPFRYTYIAELANDWIGYLPDREAFKLGGYQTWTGLHSYAEPGTGRTHRGRDRQFAHRLSPALNDASSR
jgi:neutral ceramidase